MKHHLKILEPYFSAVASGKKPFEIRFNDRDFQVGDELVLQLFDGAEFVGPYCVVTVTYLTNYEQKAGFVVMGIKL